MRTSVISGIAGQDGAFLGKLLLQKGYKVVGILPAGRKSDLFRLDYLGIRNQIQFVHLNLLDSSAVASFLEEYMPAEFYNLAAISSVGYSFTQPELTFDFNTKSVLHLLECIRKVSPQTRFYQASSSEMFGNIGEQRLPVKESFLFHPVSPYGISKASAHWLTVNYREAYGVQACCGILFNHESALRPPHFVIKKIVRTALEIQKGSTDKLTLGNTSVSRDWGYAPDYVEAMWRMLQADKLDDYLICSGSAVQLGEIVQLVFNACNLDPLDHIEQDRNLMRALDLQIIYGDNSKAKKELNWLYQRQTSDFVLKLLEDERIFMEWQESRQSE